MQKYGELIRKESTRLTDMVEQILSLAGVLSHQKTFNPQPIQVEEIIEETLDSCEEAIASQDFQIETQVAADLPEIQADAQALQGAISNLIHNALKYSNGSHWIGIEADIHKNGKGSEVQIRVSDKGIGITPEELPYIFDDFFRGTAVRNAQIKGNGIGLSIVKKTMEAHNGNISVTSEPNIGTTFTLHLPIA
jgi:signal transduction histidine kinase